MQNSSIPPKFSIPWANSAPAGNVRAIPTASQLSIQSGAASLTDGFPPLNFVPVAAGGVPPFGQDMNGILNQVTRWLQWNAAGGPTVYDGAFATAVGGYPLGAQVLSNSLNVTYESIVNNNLQDPNAGSTQWRVASSIYSGAAWQATGSSNIQVLTLAPPPSALSNLVGIPLWIRSSGTNTGAVTLNVNNLGAVSVVAPGSIPLGAGSLVTNAPFQVIYDGSVFVRISGTNVYADPNIGGLTVTSGPNGANILLAGDGTTTPNKYIRANNGTFQVVNSAYTAAVLTVSDAGALTTTGSITSGGSIVVTTNAVVNGTLTAGIGAGFNHMAVYGLSGNFVAPAAIVKVTVVGGGGPGTGCEGTTPGSNFSSGSGGGAGGVAIGVLTGLTVGASYAVTVGAGGVHSGVATNPGTQGGSSNFGSLIGATGGTSGFWNTPGSSSGGGGGTGVAGMLNIAGGEGSDGQSDGYTGMGNGASLFWGTGGRAGAGGGAAGKGFGGGGGGAYGVTAGFGGNGAPGVVVVEW